MQPKYNIQIILMPQRVRPPQFFPTAIYRIPEGLFYVKEMGIMKRWILIKTIETKQEIEADTLDRAIAIARMSEATGKAEACEIKINNYDLKEYSIKGFESIMSRVGGVL